MPPAVTTSSLEVRNLEVRAGTRVLVGPISFLHQAGSVLWLTGENGAGKSSLLRALARRVPHRGSIVPAALPRDAIGYYAPVMMFASGIHVRDWLRLHQRWQPHSHHAELVDALLPAGVHGPLTRLSTGEAKRLALWSVLRVRRPFYVLDEPFEHLSPNAKISLKQLLAVSCTEAVVVVATNQDIPRDVPARTLELD